MADPKPPAPATGAKATAAATGTAAGASSTSTASTGTYKSATGGNRALRMMGIPVLPKKLPSRNWMIFWTIAGTFSAAIIYDKREKKRATARWAHAVSHLAKEPLTCPTQMPRKLTIFLEAPPTDGLRPAQEHFQEYVKPVLAASGLDWDYVQGRKEGDVRAAVAERIRRIRNPNTSGEIQTKEELVEDIRRRNGTPKYTGIGGDIVIGRNTWKEYVRGVHEGWLGPVEAPEPPSAEPLFTPDTPTPTPTTPTEEGTETKPEGEEKKPAEEEKKPERPSQPPPHNTPLDYPTSSIPMLIPAEFSPSTPIQFPHILGFSNTPIRLFRFLNRRKLADDIGREVAAACLAASREYHDADTNPEAASPASTFEAEQATVLNHEERNWPKSVWKEAKPEPEEKEGEATTAPAPPAEKIWTNPVVLDPRITMRMRRFEITADDEARAHAIVVPEQEIEGTIKGGLRSLWRWAISADQPKPKAVYSDDD
ncbi:mitochondrial import inner membrane translocase subunit Tim54 [Xylariaceae sp. FL0255]|nr:mitochondrial import inner membrane translocase subunit Tim54 [Xylariaceae sp. FL0255]